MGKKRGGGGRRMRRDDDDDDDAMSVASVDTIRTFASDDTDFFDTITRSEGDEESMEEAIDELTEKRTTTRIAAMQKLRRILLQYLLPDAISDTFVSNVLSCMRKPGEEEAVLGSTILAIMSLIFGADDERFYQRCKNVLVPMIKAARNAKIKASSLRSLAMIGFVCAVEEENAQDFLELVHTFLDLKILGPICVGALQAWGLTASSFSDEHLSNEAFVDTYLPKFVILLDHTDVDVRAAAGENIALLFESASKCGVTLPCDDEIIEKFRSMSKDSSKKNSKKDRKTQRSAFRDIHATLTTGESPQISFSVKGDQLDVRSWRSVIQFEAIKYILRTGFQEHIKYNNALRHLLDLPETLEEHANDRRDIFDKKSYSRKQRSNELKDDRRRKQNLQESFFDY